MAKLPAPENRSTPAAPMPFVESRRAWRDAVALPVRIGWIDDDKRMAYAAGTTIDMTQSGLAVWTQHRHRISALVHLELAKRDLVAIGRVRNCVRWGKGWRTGIELVPGR